MHQTMSLSRDNVMNCTVFDDADLHDWRKGQDITVRVMRAIGVAAAASRALNAWYDGENQTRRLMSRVDVAMAVDSSEGLLVPVVRDVAAPHRRSARRRGSPQARRARSHGRAGRPARLHLHALELRHDRRPLRHAGRRAACAWPSWAAAELSHDVVAVMGGIEAHLRMPLSLTFDHRCVTGGEAARFLAALIRDLQKST